MINTVQVEIPQILERYELKYHIPFDLVEPISDFVKPYCSLDRYSEIEENNFYVINNLYLDSVFYTFLKNRLEGAEKRFNMRIRSYGKKPVPPYFFEIKHKEGDIIKKFRAKCCCENIEQLFFSSDPVNEFGFTGNEAKNIDLFRQIAISYGVEPKILTQYKRKAWISDTDDYARVTFDVDLKCMEENSFNVIPDEKRLDNYDNETIFDPGCSTILELKCYTSNVPSWMIDLIQRFNLKRGSFSKYSNGALKIIGDCRSFLRTDQSDR